MRADLDRALHAVGIAAQFDWTWELNDLDSLSTRLGWSLNKLSRTQYELTTDLNINRQDAQLHISQGETVNDSPILSLISFFVSDVVLEDPSVEPRLFDSFVTLGRRITELLGLPGSKSNEPVPELRWDLPRVVLMLVTNGEDVHIDIVNPEYETWLGWSEEEEDVFYPEILDED